MSSVCINIFGIPSDLRALNNRLCLVVIVKRTANDTHVVTRRTKITADNMPCVNTAGIAINNVKIGIKNQTLLKKYRIFIRDRDAKTTLIK